MDKLATTPPDATADLPVYRFMTLPDNSYGEPGSRRWNVETDTSGRGTNLGETMEAYIKMYPDPRTSREYYDTPPGSIFPLGDLTRVVVRELIRYLPPMSVIHLANMLENFREEAISNKKAFDDRICPCNTEIIGNQCWRHTKNRTNLFRRLPVICMTSQGEEGRMIAIEQVERLRRRIDQTTTRLGKTKHYGGTEGRNRRYAKPSGLHEAMLAGETHALADMFPPGDIEGGIIHITVLDHPRRRTIINTMGLLLLRIAGANVTVHSIRMKGRLEQPTSDGMAEMIRRQGGAACQLCIEGDQQINDVDKYNAPRWNRITEGGGRNRLPPIPHLLHNYFVRASLLGIEEQTAGWKTTMTGARKNGEYSPERWSLVEPYLRTPQAGTKEWKILSPNEPQRYLISNSESASLRMYNQEYCMVVRPRCSPIPPVGHQLTGRRQPEENWRYSDYYNPEEHYPKDGSQGEITADQHRTVRASRLGDIEYWEIERWTAEWARYNNTAAPTLFDDFAPICTDIKSLISEDEDSDTGRDVDTEHPESGEESDTSPGGESYFGSPPLPEDSCSNGYIKFPMPNVAETPEAWEAVSRAIHSDSEEYSDTEPEAGDSDQELADESGGSSDTEPGSPGWSEDRTEARGEPSKVKTEGPVPSESVKAEEVEVTGIRDGPWPDPQPDPWSEPESPDMWDYYLSSDGVARNYYFIEYGPSPKETKWSQQP